MIFLSYCLQLQDYNKSPLGEMEVKFQLTRDTLEAMLKSMTYISEQLSSMVSIFSIVIMTWRITIVIMMKNWRVTIASFGSSFHAL
jgi:hypothetical protein